MEVETKFLRLRSAVALADHLGGRRVVLAGRVGSRARILASDGGPGQAPALRIRPLLPHGREIVFLPLAFVRRLFLLAGWSPDGSRLV
jgi:hypothetical protein